MGSKSRAKKIRREAESAVAAQPLTSRQVAAGRGPRKSQSSVFKVIEASLLGIASILAYWFLAARLAGVTVSVLIDEYVYVLDAHYKAFTESGYPNHLFQLVYSTTKACGPQFYECARGINAAFVVGSAIVLYLLATHLSKNKWLGGLAWLVTIFGTFGTYTAYFMPEAIFNFFMVLFFYALIRFGNSDRILVWIGLGALLGIAALAKPHALFVVPAFVVFILLSVWSTREKILKNSFARVVPFLTALVFSKLGFGYLIAGENGFSLFGSYGYAVSSGEAVATTLGANTWLNVPGTAFGQTLMIVMILGLAIPVALAGLASAFKKDQAQLAGNQFRALFGIALLNMMAVSALFEAWQSLTTWMHTRYYSYLIPLAIVVLIEAYAQRASERTGVIKRIIVGIFVALSTYALFTQAIPYGANWVDAPDFAAHIKYIEISSLLILAAIAVSIFWLWSNKLAIQIGLGLSVFASVFAGIHITGFLNTNFPQGDPYQQTGGVLSKYLPQDQLDRTVLFGSDAVLMQRTLFYSLSGGATAMGGTHSEFDVANVDPEAQWFLAFGEPLPQLGVPHLTGNGYLLYSLKPDPENLPRNNQLRNVTNLCADPANQDWSCGPETAINIDGVFPSKASVDLVFDVGDAIAGTNLEIIIGESVGSITVPNGRFAVSLRFQNQEEAENLIIRSTSADLGNGETEQRLIRLVSANLG